MGPDPSPGFVGACLAGVLGLVFVGVGSAAGLQRARAASSSQVQVSTDDRAFADRVLDVRPGPGSQGHAERALNLHHERGSYRLGASGSVAVQFVDNRLLTSGDSRPDLWLLGQLGAVQVDVRPADRDTLVWLRRSGRGVDRSGFVGLGRFEGPEVRIDLDAVLGTRWYGQLRFDAVRVQDLWTGDAVDPFGPSDLGGIYAGTFELLPEDVVSRELSVRVVSPEDFYKADDAVGRELSVQVMGADDAFVALDVVSRELSVRVASAADDFLPTDVIGRELSVQVMSPDDAFVALDVVSRELSVQIPPPNLVVDNVAFSPALVKGGDTLTVSWRVTNHGLNTATGPWFDRLWLSADGSFAPESNIPLAASNGETLFGVLGPVVPGAWVENSQQVMVPDLPGLHFVVAQTDATGLVDEDGLLDDNTASSPLPVSITNILLPDLLPGPSLTGVPTGAVLSATALSIGYEVQNGGPGPTVGSWVDQLYLCTGPSLGGATLLASQGSVFGLSAGALYPNQFQVSLPANIQGSNFYLGLVVDGPPGAGAVVEVDDTNNVLFAGPFDITLQPQPDLVAQFLISIQGNITEGQPLTTGPGILQWQVNNVGTGPSNTGGWQEALYFSKTADPAVGPEDVLLAVYARSGAPIGPGASDGIHPAPGLEFPFSVPPGTVPAGLEKVNGYFKLFVDSGNSVTELDPPPFGEANNVAVSDPVELRKAAPKNLVAQSITATGPAIAGFALPIEFAVNPSGGTTAGAYNFSWVDRIVLEAEAGGASFQLGNYAQSNQPNVTSQWLGVEYTKTVSPVVPASVPPGAYRLRLLVDAGAQVDEVNESDNEVLSAPFDVAFVPVDLALTLPTDAAPSAGAVQQTIPLSFTVTNLGPGKTIQSSWVDRVHLSVDGTTPLGAPIASRTQSGALAAGQSYTVVTTGKLPVQPPGNYFLLFSTDATDVVPEVDPANNSASVPFTLSPEAADLVVSGVLADRNAAEGQPFTVSWLVANQGSFATTTGAWTDRIWLSQDELLGPDDLLLGSRAHSGALAVGQGYQASRTVQLPYGVTGLRYLLVETDGLAQVYESNDNNNVSARQVLTLGEASLADLTVSGVSALANAVAGQPLEVTWTVENVGAGATNTAEWVDRVYLSLDAVLTPGDTLLGFHEHGAFLDAGNNSIVTRSFLVPSKLAGNYFVLVETNGQKEVLEAGSASNVAFGSQPVAIALPLPADLVVEDVETLGTWEVNQPALIRYRVRNIGQNTVQGQWRDAVFLGEGADVDGSSVLLAQYTVVPPTSLSPGESVLVERDLGKLPGVLPKNYRAVVRADVLNQIPEPSGLDVNLGASPPLAIDVPLLGLGALGELELNLASGQSAWFRMTPPAGTTVRWTATHEAPNAWITLFASEAHIPTPGTAQVSGLIPASAVQSLLVEAGASPTGTWYGLVRASTGAPLGSRVRLSAQVVPLELAASETTTVGAGTVTLRLAGEKLNAVTVPSDVRLSFGNTPGGTPIFGAQELLFDPQSGDLLARFGLQGAPLGTYSLQVQTADGSEVSALPGGILVQSPTSGLVAVQVEPPAGVKKGNVGFAAVRIQNAGNVDLERGVLTLLLDPAQGSASAGGLLWSVQDIASAQPSTDGQVDSLVLFAPNLAPGQSASAVLRLDVPAAFPSSLATFGLSGRPLDGSGWYAPLAPPSASLLGRLSEALRQAVLASEASPADLLTLANSGGWSIASDQAFAPFLGSPLALVPTLQSLGAALDALAASVADNAQAGSAPPAAALASVRGQLACLVFEGTSLACQDLLAPSTCNPGVSAAPVLIGAGSNIPVAAVCWPTPTSIDPNEKRNKPGFGPQQQVAASAPIDYRIEFENIATAEASASFVEIFDALQTGLDPSTFELRTIRFGENVIEVPPGNAFYFGALDLTETAGVIVQVSAGLVFFDGQDDERFAANGLRRPPGFEGTGAAVLWSLVAIDPTTGLPPVSGLTGVLPPNSPEQDGTGHVEFASGLVPGPGSGLPVRNQAKIKFDAEAALTTNQVTNTVDVKAPISDLLGDFFTISGTGEGNAVAGLAQLTWSAGDDEGGSGVLDHTVYVSVDDGPFEPFLVNTAETATSYPVEFGKKYAFHVRSRDNTGQLESAPLKPGFEIFVGTDCNGNGIEDALDIQTGTSFDCNFNGIPDECEPDSNGDGIIDACTPLTADIFSVSVAAGGVQRLSLQAGIQNANRTFLFVGSLSGSLPGVVIDGLTVPINIDSYTQYLFNLPPDSLLLPLVGQLDDQGRAKAQVTVPPGLLPTTPGLHLTHTYLLLDPVLDFAPRPVTLRLLP